MSDRPLLSLVMIVKDEAASIVEVLEHALPHCDRWTVYDTGSADGTQDLVRCVADRLGVPGRLFEGPFGDFSTARNTSLLEDAASSGCEFQLVLSGDEFLRGGNELRAYLEAQRASGVDLHAVKLTLDDLAMFAPRVFRAGSTWHYEGLVHEVPVNRADPGAKLGVAPAPCLIEHVVADAGKRLETVREVHVPLLQKILEEDPVNERALIFLAQSYEALFPLMTDAEKLMYSLESMGLLIRRLAVKTGNEAERNWCKLQYLDFAKGTGVYSDKEVYDRATQLFQESPRPEVALLAAWSSLKVVPARKVHELASFAAQLAATYQPDDTTPQSTSVGWRAHYLAAVAANQLAKSGATPGPRDGVSWADAVQEHTREGVKAGGLRETFDKFVDLPPLRRAGAK